MSERLMDMLGLAWWFGCCAACMLLFYLVAWGFAAGLSVVASYAIDEDAQVQDAGVPY